MAKAENSLPIKNIVFRFIAVMILCSVTFLPHYSLI